MRSFLLLILISIVGVSFGQTILNHSLIGLNNIFYNPSYSGSQNYFHANLSYRNQWKVFQDAPQQNRFAIGGPLKNNRLGVGLCVLNFKSGILQSNTIRFDINYQLKLDEKGTKLVFGLGMGAYFSSLNFNLVNTTISNDPSFQYNQVIQTTPITSFGAFYSDKKNQAGISKNLTIGSGLSEFAIDDPWQFFYQRKNKISTKNEILALAQIQNFNRYTILQVQGIFVYQELVSLGVGYKSNKTISLIAGVKPISQLNLQFAYDYSLNSKINVPMNTIEFAIQYEFGKIINASNTRIFD